MPTDWDPGRRSERRSRSPSTGRGRSPSPANGRAATGRGVPSPPRAAGLRQHQGVTQAFRWWTGRTSAHPRPPRCPGFRQHRPGDSPPLLVRSVDRVCVPLRQRARIRVPARCPAPAPTTAQCLPYRVRGPSARLRAGAAAHSEGSVYLCRNAVRAGCVLGADRRPCATPTPSTSPPPPPSPRPDGRRRPPAQTCRAPARHATPAPELSRCRLEHAPSCLVTTQTRGRAPQGGCASLSPASLAHPAPGDGRSALRPP